jgi:putative flippase GtrA
LFSVLLALTGHAMLSTLVARVVSGVANFSINKLMVFNAATSHQLVAEAGKYTALI